VNGYLFLAVGSWDRRDRCYASRSRAGHITRMAGSSNRDTTRP